MEIVHMKTYSKETHVLSVPTKISGRGSSDSLAGGSCLVDICGSAASVTETTLYWLKYARPPSRNRTIL